MIDVLTLIAALGSGLMAGFFFAFSVLVMPALARLPTVQGATAMNTINVVVLNAWFLAAFFGTALLCVALVVATLAGWSAGNEIYVWVGAALYLVGVIVVTMAFNVPLNNALAKADPASEAGAALWRRYLTDWTAWNHVRTLAPLAACTCFILALR